jgi:hypothetical protein
MPPLLAYLLLAASCAALVAVAALCVYAEAALHSFRRVARVRAAERGREAALGAVCTASDTSWLRDTSGAAREKRRTSA